MMNKSLKLNHQKKHLKRRRAGFSLMELLVAMAVMLLFTLVMTSLMNTATMAYEESVSASNADVFVSNMVSKLRQELSDARDIQLIRDKDTFDSLKTKYGTGDYSMDTSSSKYRAICYTDAATGAECMIFLGRKSSKEPWNVYISKYGEVTPLVFTDGELYLTFSKITKTEKTVSFVSIEVKDSSSTVYTALDKVSVKLK